ncbi:BZ3500_MvSof-1268-A1-R1_Chr10-2g02838 [Microbotryum saponariae]|uniref:BZ3500_MvSof-1268-A1-R1_Chr10-2g02838 protein n=1 Tax=Microbotryum saponariae TaxID=289078 RepID=A0A2X0L078_9BASI|nr:BZ3500_MvSof-1268-A1-R1_Chr3-1g05627 [Microbotryum saponariae]SDA01608.1 BZ3500_MvSof-1268-A1-R1_Chr10-2g02838 [Microbotryum saponariae]SDA04817.1 BZ3501_MvSof-1269-A2-R1_Chr3-1g05297 [Microbotryum saponariae]
MSSLSAPSNASDFAAPTPASVQSTNSADMGSVLSPITVQTQQNHLPAPSGATPECGRSTPLASRPTSSNSIDQQIKQIQEEIRALHDAVRALPSTSRMSSSQKQPHVLYGLQRRLETMKYCLHHGVRDDDLDSYMPRAIRRNDTNDWNAFKTSRFFHCLVEKDGLEGERGVCLSSSSRDRSFWHFKTLLYASLTHKLITLYPYKVSKDFSSLNTIGSRYWEKVKDSPDLYEQWKEAHKYEKTIHELVHQHADTYGFDALVIVGSNKLENKNDRFIVSTLGGAAFMRRQSWGSQKNDVLVNFTECINGTRFNQERDEQFKMEAHHGDVDKASHRVLCTWYRIIIDDYYKTSLFSPTCLPSLRATTRKLLRRIQPPLLSSSETVFTSVISAVLPIARSRPLTI